MLQHASDRNFYWSVSFFAASLYKCVIDAFVVFTLFCFVNIPATNGLISPTNVSLIVDKDNLHINDSGSSSTVSSSVGSSTITVIDKPSAVPPRGCSIHFQVVPLNETNVITFPNVTTATSTMSCARKCYLSGCTVAQFLPGVPDLNTGTCRLSFGSEPSKCQLPDTSKKLKPEDPAHIQCLRCSTALRTTTITTPTLPSTTTTVSILKLSDNEVDSSIDSSPKIIPPSTQTSPKILEQLKSSELFSNSIVSNNLKTLTQNDSTNTVVEWKTTTVQSVLKPVKPIDNKFQPKAFIAATAEFENGKNLTLKFVGDEKYSNPPGVVPEKPGFSPDFNETAGSNSTNDLDNFSNSAFEGKKNFTETTIFTISLSINLPLQNQKKVSNDATERTLVELNSTSNVTLPVNLKSVNQSFDNETTSFMNSTSTVSTVPEFSTQNSLSVNHTDLSVNQTNFSNEISSNFSFQKSGSSSNETADIFNKTVLEEHNNFTSSTIQLKLLSTLLPATIATENVSANSAVNSTQSPRIELETNRTTNLHSNNLTTELPSHNVTADFPLINATSVLPLNDVTTGFHVSLFDNFTRSAENETSTISQVVNNSSLQVNSSNLHDTSKFIIGNQSLPVNDAVAEIQNKPVSVVSSKLSSFKGFGGGCAVFFHISNASAISTTVFTNTTSATSVSNCARKCYLFGCRVAQYIPNGSLCRLSFTLRENELCTQYHKEYTGFATEDPVQLECLRCSNKKIQSPLQGPL